MRNVFGCKYRCRDGCEGLCRGHCANFSIGNGARTELHLYKQTAPTLQVKCPSVTLCMRSHAHACIHAFVDTCVNPHKHACAHAPSYSYTYIGVGDAKLGTSGSVLSPTYWVGPDGTAEHCTRMYPRCRTWESSKHCRLCQEVSTRWCIMGPLASLVTATV